MDYHRIGPNFKHEVIHLEELIEEHLGINSTVAIIIIIGIFLIKLLICFLCGRLCCKYCQQRRRIREMERNHSLEHLDELLRLESNDASGSRSMSMKSDEESTDLSGSYDALL